MLRVPIQQAKTKMVLARSIPNPLKPEYTLLKAGFTLDDESVQKLQKLKVPNIWVNYPNLDFLDDQIDPELIRQQQQLYGSLKEHFSSSQELVLAKIDYSRYISQITALFQRLLNQKSPSSSFIGELQAKSDDIFLHGVTTASVALLLGLKLEHYLVQQRPNLPSRLAFDLTALGLGCLIHDIGKLLLDEQLRSFHITALDLGSPLWQHHTEIGFDLLKHGLDPTAAQVVLNHHQHFDGSGFPGRKPSIQNDGLLAPLKGADIHIFSRIACVADRFEGFRYLPDGSVAPNVVAVKRMHNSGYTKWFDPQIYHAFMKTIPPFTPGEQVTLNNGKTVVVTEFNEDQPCRPIVRPIDPQLAVSPDIKSTVETPDINLATRNDLHIACVGDFNVQPYLF